MPKHLTTAVILVLAMTVTAVSCKKSDTGKSFVLTYQLKFDGTLINAPVGGTPQVQYTFSGFQPTTESLSSGSTSWSKSISVSNAPTGTQFTLSTPNALYFATTSGTLAARCSQKRMSSATPAAASRRWPIGAGH